MVRSGSTMHPPSIEAGHAAAALDGVAGEDGR